MQRHIAIHWFRQDLRLADNPALTQAATHTHVLPIYILDDNHAGDYALGGASRWWLYYSLLSLRDSLNGHLSIYQGDPLEVLLDITRRLPISAVYWNRCYAPWQRQRDTQIKQRLKDTGIAASSKNGSLLWEPWTIQKKDNTPYKVFTPFYQKGCLQSPPPRTPVTKPDNMRCLRDEQALADIPADHLLPTIRWDAQLEPHWRIGEEAAQQRLQTFMAEGLAYYKEQRNFPARPAVSRLSPYLRFGEISPNQLWYVVQSRESDPHIAHFCSELGWREFSYSQLYHNPDLPTKNLQAKFDAFPWVENQKWLRAWQRGLTGIPMVDAGMRELWQTGYMHNRVRMVVGSFLVKNLRLHWQHGARWFWNTLVDADLANNSASWQWIAGCGADAVPYFRIFNPVTQGQKFDPDGRYIRCFIPEIAHLPDHYLFSPWQAPEQILRDAAVKLGDTYPVPIIDLKQSREAALAAFQSLTHSSA